MVNKAFSTSTDGKSAVGRKSKIMSGITVYSSKDTMLYILDVSGPMLSTCHQVYAQEIQSCRLRGRF